MAEPTITRADPATTAALTSRPTVDGRAVARDSVAMLRNATADGRPLLQSTGLIQQIDQRITASVTDPAARAALRDELTKLRSADPNAFRRLSGFVSNFLPRGELGTALREAAALPAPTSRDRVDARRAPTAVADATPAGITVDAPPVERSATTPTSVSRGSVTSLDQVLTTNPQFRQSTIRALQNADGLLLRARTAALSSGDTTLAANLDTARVRTETAIREAGAEQPNFANVGSAITESRAALERARSSDVLPRGTRGLFDSALTDLQRLGAPRNATPRDVLDRGDRFLATYRNESVNALNGLLAQPVTDWNFGDLGSGRLRVDDAMHATLRLNTSVWSVQRDLRAGTLEPSNFGRRDWNSVTSADMYALAQRRLQSSDVDWNAETRGMLADRSVQPLRVNHPQHAEPVALEPRNISFMSRSVGSVLSPTDASLELANMEVSRTVANGAIAVGDSAEADRSAIAARARLATADTLFRGSAGADDQRRLPQNVTQINQALMDVTNTRFRVDELPANATAASIQAGGRVLGMLALPNPDGTERRYVMRPIENTQQLATEIQRRIAAGGLNGLDAETRARVAALTANNGSAITTRENIEASERWWRERQGAVTGAIIEAIPATILSMGVGGVVATGLSAANATNRTVTAARVVSSSLAFTGTMQGLNGHFDAAQYPLDLVTMGLVTRAGVIAQPLSRAIGGETSALRRGLATTAAGVTMATAGSAVGTGVNTVRSLINTGQVDWNQQLNGFLDGVVTGTIMHQGAAHLGPTSARALPPRPAQTGERLSLMHGLARIEGTVVGVNNGRATVRVPTVQTIEIDANAVSDLQVDRNRPLPAEQSTRQVEVPAEAAARLSDPHWRYAPARQRLDAVELPVGTTPARGEFLGRGQFSNVYASADGRMVIKEIHSTMRTPSGQTIEVSHADRVAIARRTVEQINDMRARGFPVPRAWLSPDNPTVVIQQRATGITRNELGGGRAGADAAGERLTMVGLAERERRVMIDRDPDANNFRYNRDGTIESWFDPGIPVDTHELVNIRHHVMTAGPY